ncbi:hypothetical protein STEG23_016107, partial [Scotinomys teguina]
VVRKKNGIIHEKMSSTKLETFDNNCAKLKIMEYFQRTENNKQISISYLLKQTNHVEITNYSKTWRTLQDGLA